MTATTTNLITITEARRVRGGDLATGNTIVITDTLIADVRVLDTADYYLTNREAMSYLPAAAIAGIEEGDDLVVYVRVMDLATNETRNDIWTYRTWDVVSLAW